MKTITALLLASASAFAQDQQVGARTKAMGGSYTAFEDDPVSVWLNPAGIATQADGFALAYQTYTIYEPNADEQGAAGSGPPSRIPGEYAWTDPALIPSYLGVVFNVGDDKSPQAVGFCFTTPFRLKFSWNDSPGLGNQMTAFTNQALYRFRMAYARDFLIREPGTEGLLTHIAFGVGLDVSVTSWEYTNFNTGTPDTTQTFSGSDMGFGAGFGFLMGLYDNTRNFKVNFGAAFQSKAAYEFSISSDIVPLFEWPNQFQAGLTFYLLDGLPLRITMDAQLIGWDAAIDSSDVPGRDDFGRSTNFSAGAEYRIQASEKLRLLPRAGIRFFDAPWEDEDKSELPAVKDLALIISTRSEAFLIVSVGLGFSWNSAEGKARSFDIAADIGGDAPNFAMSFTLEF
jgi:hypothetical protein